MFTLLNLTSRERQEMEREASLIQEKRVMETIRQECKERYGYDMCDDYDINFDGMFEVCLLPVGHSGGHYGCCAVGDWPDKPWWMESKEWLERKPPKSKP